MALLGLWCHEHTEVHHQRSWTQSGLQLRIPQETGRTQVLCSMQLGRQRAIVERRRARGRLEVCTIVFYPIIHAFFLVLELVLLSNMFSTSSVHQAAHCHI